MDTERKKFFYTLERFDKTQCHFLKINRKINAVLVWKFVLAKA